MNSLNGSDEDYGLNQMAHTVLFVVMYAAASTGRSPVDVCNDVIDVAPRRYIKDTLRILRTKLKEK